MGQQHSKDEHGKPRSSIASCACCGALSRCFSRAGNAPGATGSASVQLEKQQAVTQPLVVEDESWKKWSSYNLIHHPPGGAAAASASQYRPPAFVSHTSQQDVGSNSGEAAASTAATTRAEAVWEL